MGVTTGNGGRPGALVEQALALDATDPIGGFTSRFLPSPGVVAYLDGNSLGRPVAGLVERMTTFLQAEWGTRLIRAWDEGWMDQPYRLGDRIGRLTLGAAAGQVFVGDSTTVLIYKVLRAAVAGRPERTEIVLADAEFPTDRYVAQGVAQETGLTVRWLSVYSTLGVSPEQVAAAVSDQTAAVLFSHVAYRSGFVADAAKITRIVHDCGAIAIWDLCHSVGVIPVELDSWQADFAVGCTYKYLGGGPGAPAFAYVRADLQDQFRQPIQGWMGAADIFAMAPGFTPGPGIRSFVSGTPPVLAMLATDATLDLIEEAGLAAIHAKSQALTDFAERALQEYVLPLGARLSSPPAGPHRGSHLMVSHPAFRTVTARLWERGVIPDFRAPDGIRLGLSPLSTTFSEVEAGMWALGEELMIECAGR